jgi:hypothetical protein
MRLWLRIDTMAFAGFILPDVRASGSALSELSLMRGSPTIIATPMVTGILTSSRSRLSKNIDTPPVMHQPMTSSPFLCKQSWSQEDQPTPPVALPAGNPAMVELLPPRKKTRLDLHPEDSGHSTSLKDPQVLVKKYMLTLLM